MSDHLTRRGFVKRAAVGLAVASVPGLGLAQDTQPNPANDAALDAAVSDLEKLLAEPLSEELKKLTREAVRGNRRAAESRHRFALPENSEPCTVFHSTPFQAKGAR